MAKAHDIAARLIAKKLGGNYNPKRSPDVISKERQVEVKTYATEIPKALNQLGTSSNNKQYVALPAGEHENAKRHLKSTGVGLMDLKGNVKKRPRRP